MNLDSIIELNNDAYFKIYAKPLRRYVLSQSKNDKQKYKNVIEYFLLHKNEDLNITPHTKSYISEIDIVDKFMFVNNISPRENHFSLINDTINELSIKNMDEVKKRIKYIQIVIERIYKLILNDNKSIEKILKDKQSLISSIQIITIVKLKKDPLQLSQLFNLSKSINIDDHIKNLLNIYDQIDELLKYPHNILEYIEELISEYKNLFEMLDDFFYNNVPEIIHQYVEEINLILNEDRLDDLSDIYDSILDEIKSNNNVIILTGRLNELENNNIDVLSSLDSINHLISKKPTSSYGELNILITKKNKLLEIFKNTNNEIYTIKSTLQYISFDYTIDTFNIEEINFNLSIIQNYFKSEHKIDVTFDDLIMLFSNCPNCPNCNIKTDMDILEILENKESFIRFVKNLKIIQKKITNKNKIILLALFNIIPSDTYNEWFSRIKKNGLLIINKILLNEKEIDYIIDDISFFLKDIIIS
jgi:hypothetical protein